MENMEMPKEMADRARQYGPDVPRPVDTPEELQRRLAGDAVEDKQLDEITIEQIEDENEQIDGITIEQIGALIFEARADPNSERIVALRLALEEIDREAQARRDHVEASQAVAGGARWGDVADNHVPHDELVQLRAEQAALPRRPEPHPDLVTAFDRAQEEDVSRREAWRRDDEAPESGQALTR